MENVKFLLLGSVGSCYAVLIEEHLTNHLGLRAHLSPHHRWGEHHVFLSWSKYSGSEQPGGGMTQFL